MKEDDFAAKSREIVPPVDGNHDAPRSPAGALKPRWLPIAYASLGAVWILGSDYVLGILLDGRHWDITQAQTVKGLVFVAVTAVSLYLIMAHYARQLSRNAQKLAKSSKSLRDFSEAATDWLWEMGPDLRISSISGRFKEITGEEPDAIIGLSRDDLISMADAEFARRAEFPVKAHLAFRDLIYPYTDSKGRRFHFRLSGKPVFRHDGTFLGYRGVGSDVSREIELRKARDRLAEIIEATPDFVATAEPAGKVLFINRGGRKMLGIEPDEDLNQLSGKDLRPSDAQEQFRTEILPTALAKDRWSGRTKLLHRNGESRIVSVVLLTHKSANGEVDFLSMIARDVTDEIRAEERFRRAQRMDALGQLTGGVAHDFNNLLMIIMGSAEALVDRMSDDDKGRRLAESILQTSELGADLTHRLLSFSRKQALRPERVDAAALLAAMEPLLNRTLGADIIVETHIPEGLWPVIADKGELETCLLNLAVNARDAMPDGGTLSITLANEHITTADAYSIEELSKGDYVAISVTDTGVGIPADILGRVFEPFFTTKGPQKGNGLGLSMVYGFAKQSGGHVTVYSEPDRGTVFRLFLPRAITEADKVSDTASKSATPPGNGETILVVEDDPMVRTYLTAQLEHLGYRVHVAAQGSEALTCLNDIPELDLLLTDIVMPGGLSGHEVAREVRLRRPGTKVLFTTGYNDQSRTTLKSEDAQTPIAPILYKPYRRSRLEEAVREALATPAP